MQVDQKYVDALLKRVEAIEKKSESVLNHVNSTPPERKLYSDIKALAGFAEALKMEMTP